MNEPLEGLTREEMFELGAKDGIWFAHEFFPKTFRQESPEFHYEMMREIEALENQFIGFEIFRDGAKTTMLRVAMAKRVSYGLTRVGVYSSASQRHAERSVRWLKRQVMYNRHWAEFYGLHRGEKWTDSEIEIYHSILDIHIHVLAVGMTGQTRGVNLDDYRPDFWIWDDIDDEETTGSEDQRMKQTNRFFGAMANTLAPLSENPHSKGVLAQTPLDKDDIVAQCKRDLNWRVLTYGIFDEFGNSRWEGRHPTEEQKAKKANAISNGRLHIWMREKECKIVPSEGKAFNIDHVRFYDWDPESMIVFIGIDPAREKTRSAKTAHKSAIVQIGVNDAGIFLLDYYAQKGKNPEEIWTEFYRMALRYPPRLTGVESIAYQQTLAWYFRQRMKELGHYFVVREIEDKRKKPERIRQAHAIIDSGRFHVRRSHTEYLESLDSYQDDKDIDLLDAGAIAITLSSPTLLMLASSVGGNDDEDYEILINENESHIPDLPEVGYCP